MAQDVKGSTALVRFRNGKTKDVPISLLRILELPTLGDLKGDGQLENNDTNEKKSIDKISHNSPNKKYIK